MKFQVTAMLVHADGTSHRHEQTARADSHADAISESEDLLELLGEPSETDTLVVIATPTEPTDEDESQKVLDAICEGMTKPITREECLERAKRAETPGERAWWEEEATASKSEAEGGGPIPDQRASLDARRMAELRAKILPEKRG